VSSQQQAGGFADASAAAATTATEAAAPATTATARRTLTRASSGSILAGVSGIPSCIPSAAGALLPGRPVTRRSLQAASSAGQPTASGQGAAAPTPASTARTRTTRAKAAAAAATTHLTAIAEAPAADGAEETPRRAASPLHVSQRYASRRLSTARKPRPSMDKLQTDYEALQARLALMKPRPGGVAATPMSAAAPRAAAAAAATACKETPLPVPEPAPAASARGAARGSRAAGKGAPAAAALEAAAADAEPSASGSDRAALAAEVDAGKSEVGPLFRLVLCSVFVTLVGRK
jgi:hypothetical protein